MTVKEQRLGLENIFMLSVSTSHCLSKNQMAMHTVLKSLLRRKLVLLQTFAPVVDHSAMLAHSGVSLGREITENTPGKIRQKINLGEALNILQIAHTCVVSLRCVS